MPNGRRTAEMIQADWAKIGVTANITTYEWGEYLKRSRAGEPSVGMLGGTWDYPDPQRNPAWFHLQQPRQCVALVQPDLYGRGAEGERRDQPGRARASSTSPRTRRCMTTSRWCGWRT